MKILELFCGTKSISKVFKEHGASTFTLDFNPKFNPDICGDILSITAEDIVSAFGYPDIIWASPPCTTFSVASLGHHWTGGKNAYVPKTPECVVGMEILRHTLKLIEELQPKLWFIENPRGVMRKMPEMQGLPRYTVTYCQYNDERMKPTDIWSNHASPEFRPMCKNGDPCHTSAPRGSRTGTQGLKGAEERSVIPRELCEHVYSLCHEVFHGRTME